MGRTCSVPNCKTGYCGYDDKVSIFSLPKDEETVSKWRAVFEEFGKTVNSYTFVCEKHFTQDDIVAKWSNGVIKIDYKRKKLKKGAVPVISPEYLQEIDKSRRNRTPKRKTSDTVSDQPSKALKSTEVCSGNTVYVVEPEAVFIEDGPVSVKEEPLDDFEDSLVDPLLIAIKKEDATHIKKEVADVNEEI